MGQEVNIPISQCPYCIHLNKDWTCAAFPDGIPAEVMNSKYDHREPYPGDNGIQFDPVNDEAAEMVAELFTDGEDE